MLIHLFNLRRDFQFSTCYSRVESDRFSFYNTYSSTKYLYANTCLCLLHTTKYKYLANHSMQSRSSTLSFICELFVLPENARPLSVMETLQNPRETAGLKRQKNQFNLLLHHCLPNELLPSPLLPFSTECQLWMFCKSFILKFPGHTLYINVGQLNIDQVHPWPDNARLFECFLSFIQVYKYDTALDFPCITKHA